MSSKSSDFSTSSSYGSTLFDASDASSLVSLTRREVEDLMEDFKSRPISREVVCHPENSLQFDQHFHGETGFFDRYGYRTRRCPQRRAKRKVNMKEFLHL